MNIRSFILEYNFNEGLPSYLKKIPVGSVKIVGRKISGIEDPPQLLPHSIKKLADKEMGKKISTQVKKSGNIRHNISSSN